MKKDCSFMEDDTCPEYDLTSMRVRRMGPLRRQFGNTMRLEPDVALAFPDAEAVNEALRRLICVTQENVMKINPESDLNDELRPEYTEEDMKNMERGKYVGRVTRSGPIVMLAPDVAQMFPDVDAVNEALRFLLRVTKQNVKEIAPSEAA